LKEFECEEVEMADANGMLEGLMDFSFRRYATPKMLKFLYAVHLLAGLIAGVAWVVLAFQQAPVQGLLALLGALVGYSLWILYCRVALEVLAAVFRIANAVAPSRGDLQQPEYSESSGAEMVGAR
jgi:xanthosine utilization system XapX-like protein